MFEFDINPANEFKRLEALERTGAQTHTSETTFKQITELVALYLGLPTATISLMMEDKQVFKARFGLDLKETPRSSAFCDITIRQNEPLVIEDTHRDARVKDNPLVTGEPYLRSYIGVPLTTSDGYNIGTICAFDTRPTSFDKRSVDVMRKFAELVMYQLELRAQADRDPLTGAMNRRSFEAVLRAELDRLNREPANAVIAYVDIDYFKQVNDSYGHPTGDIVLKEFTEILSGACRSVDRLARMGGEEFAILLPNTDLASARVWAERIRETVSGHKFGDDNFVKITASLGLVEIGHGTSDLDTVMEMADENLYRAKRRGRNCIAA